MIRSTIRGFGELLISFGLIVLLFAAYEVYGKAFQVNAEQSRLGSALDREWGAPPSNSGAAPGGRTTPAVDKPIPGRGVARLYIPRLDKHWVVVEGVTQADIKLAPGHYPESQLPGDVGNFAVAGHRMPSVFWDLDVMRNGDPVVAETRAGWYVYRVKKLHIIRPTNTSVKAANPDHPGQPPTRKLLTITTCNPKWDNYERLVLQAELVRQQPKTAGRPAELGG